jgi:poly(A) polymerase
MGKLLLNIPSARRLDEINKLFLYGKAYETFKLLNKLDLLRYLFPSLTLMLNKRDKNMYYTNFIKTSLKETDNRIKMNKPVMLPFFLSCMLWPSLAEKIGEITSTKTKLSELRLNARRIIYAESEFCSIPKRMQSSIIEIWEFQIRLLKTNTPKANDLIRHKRFRAGYDFLINREKAGLYLNDLGYWWTNFQRINPKQRQKMISISKKFGTKKITKTPKGQQIDIELKLE